MKAKAFIDQVKRQAKLIDALLFARYTLVIHDRKMCSAEGETWELNFSAELAEIDVALQMAGIDTTQPLHAPIRWRDEDE
ncbi:hypothetical protein [Paraburkholderia hospita]|jgi:hypothetical protein|uniref:hypothetical protein n=1 Tax=Paraburkholderia hospita TaxID=169430 RepID=UPI0008A7B82D|nr:hypothetical protein [Paraburkholderia hospita]SEI21503.1 hypothetical protein SAMN05192544_104040 [Paraburkholderia hospita]